MTFVLTVIPLLLAFIHLAAAQGYYQPCFNPKSCVTNATPICVRCNGRDGCYSQWPCSNPKYQCCVDQCPFSCPNGYHCGSFYEQCYSKYAHFSIIIYFFFYFIYLFIYLFFILFIFHCFWLLVLKCSFNPVYPAVGAACFLVFIIIVFFWWRRRRMLYADETVTVTHVDDVYNTNHGHHHHHHHQPGYDVIETRTHHYQPVYHEHVTVHTPQPTYVNTNPYATGGQTQGTAYAPDNVGYQNSNTSPYQQPGQPSYQTNTASPYQQPGQPSYGQPYNQ
jgi:hypothetical protein